MSPSPYTEDQLIEQPAIQLFAKLGWETLPSVDVLVKNDAAPPSPLGMLSRR